MTAARQAVESAGVDAARKTVTLTDPELAGEWEVQSLDGGDLLLRRPRTTLADILERHGGRPAGDEEIERHLGELPTDFGE